MAVSSPPATATGRRSAPQCAPRYARRRRARARPLLLARPRRRPVAHLRGSGTGRILLLGHLDTVIAHEATARSSATAKLVGSGSVDMKGGVVLARRPARARRAAAGLRGGRAAAGLRRGVADRAVRAHRALRRLRRVPVLRGRRAHAGRRGGRRRAPQGGRHAAVHARGRAAHSGSAPDRGRNALLALAAAAQAVAGCHDPNGEDHLTAVPTVMHAGDAFNVVPGAGELISDMRADTSDAFERVPPRPGRGRRRDAAPGDGALVAGHGQHGDASARCWSAPRRRSARPSRRCTAAAPATPATSRPRSP